MSPRLRWIALTTGFAAFSWFLLRLVLLNPAFLDPLRVFVDARLPSAPAWMTPVATDLVALGSPVLLTLAAGFATAALLLRRQPRSALLIAASAAGGSLVAYGLAGALPGAPSGAATMSAIVYLSVGAVLVCVVRERRVQRFVIASTLVLTALVAVSRGFLTAHGPTDVLAGLLLGSAWALLSALVARSLQRSRQLEAAR